MRGTMGNAMGAYRSAVLDGLQQGALFGVRLAPDIHRVGGAGPHPFAGELGGGAPAVDLELQDNKGVGGEGVPLHLLQQHS